MARIIGGIATSHTPTIGFAFDGNKQDDPIWAPIFKGYEPVQEWLAEKKPDVLLFIYNDHVTSFFFDHYSAFALGVGDNYPVADEGGGARNLPPAKGHPELAQHIGTSLMADEFDMSFFQNKAMDHGFFSPLSMLCPHKPDWPVSVVPLQVGVLQFPIPTAKRCFNLGKALRKAIESFPEDLDVALVATGGLSHQVHGEGCGFNNTEWDAQFMELFEKDPEKLTDMTQAEYVKLGGMEGAEIIMWLIMRGALSANVEKLHQSYYLPSMTGIATMLFENQALDTPVDTNARHREHMAKQLAGVEELEGTYPFTLATSLKAYRLNEFMHKLIIPEHREKYLADKESLFEEYKLTEEERELLREPNWIGLIQYGVIFFMLEKLGAVIGVSNPHIYASMRGETMEEFQASRNTNALYSVAGGDTSTLDWNSDDDKGDQ